MRATIATAFFIFTLSILGCSKDPKSVRITESNKDKLVEEVKDLKGLTIDESRLLFTALMRNSLAASFGQSKTSLVGKTVGEVIADQRSFEADSKKREEEQSKLATEAKAADEAIATELRKSINLTVFQKNFLGPDTDQGRYSSSIVLKCTYKNSSPKDIRAFTGTIKFTDLFDKPIFESNITISDPVKKDGKGNWTGSIDYNQFMDSHRSLRNAELKDMKVVWNPKTIIYSDGSKVGKSD